MSEATNTELWHSARRILAVRLDAMGDVLMTTPALRAIKESGGAELTLLTSPSGAAIARQIPEIDRTLTFDAPWMPARGTVDAEQDRARLQSLISLLEGEAFDAAIVFTVFTQNPLPAAMVTYMAGIPLRASHTRENPYSLLTNWVRDVDRDVAVANVRHEVRRQLDLVAALGFQTDDERLSIWCSSEAVRTVERLLEAHHLGERERWVAMHTGAMALSRRYPADKFAEVARTLEESGTRVLLTGAHTERDALRRIADASGALSLADELTLDELIALVSAAPLIITNNSGPAHIAAAVGTPVVDLYALTNPQHTPWQVPNIVLNHDVSCRYCFKSVCPQGHHACLDAVEPARVVEAARMLLSDTRSLRVPTPSIHSLHLPLAL